MLWNEDKALKVILSISFLQLDEENKRTVLPHKLADCRIQPTTVEEESLLVVEWHKLIFPRGNEGTLFPLTTYRGDVAVIRCKVKKLFL